jgi:hypothetical protein
MRPAASARPGSQAAVDHRRRTAPAHGGPAVQGAVRGARRRDRGVGDRHQRRGDGRTGDGGRGGDGMARARRFGPMGLHLGHFRADGRPPPEHLDARGALVAVARRGALRQHRDGGPDVGQRAPRSQDSGRRPRPRCAPGRGRRLPPGMAGGHGGVPARHLPRARLRRRHGSAAVRDRGHARPRPSPAIGRAQPCCGSPSRASPPDLRSSAAISRAAASTAAASVPFATSATPPPGPSLR